LAKRLDSRRDQVQGWKVSDGVLIRQGNGAGDLITKNKYKFFELMLEYKISEGGNSGLIFHVGKHGDTTLLCAVSIS